MSKFIFFIFLTLTCRADLKSFLLNDYEKEVSPNEDGEIIGRIFNTNIF